MLAFLIGLFRSTIGLCSDVSYSEECQTKSFSILKFYILKVLTHEQACAALSEISPGSKLVSMSLKGGNAREFVYSFPVFSC